MANPSILSQSPICFKYMLTVKSILIFLFLIIEIYVLNSFELYTENPLVIVDNLVIFILAIIYKISFIFSLLYYSKNN